MNLTKKVIRYYTKEDTGLPQIGKIINKWPKEFEKFKNKPNWFYEIEFAPELLRDVYGIHGIEIEELFQNFLETSEPRDIKIDSITVNDILVYHFYHDTEGKRIKRLHTDTWVPYDDKRDIKNYFVKSEINKYDEN